MLSETVVVAAKVAFATVTPAITVFNAVPPTVIASASSVPSISASPETSKLPASNSPDRVIFLNVPISLFESTTTPKLAVTVPAVTASRTLSSAAVVVTAVPPINSLSFTMSTTVPPAVRSLSALSSHRR